MARPVVGIYAQVAQASWGPWVDRLAAVAPAVLARAAQRCGAAAVVLAPDPGLERLELLGRLDALIVFDDAAELDALLGAARELGLAVLVLDPERIAPDATSEDFDREIAALL